MTYTPNVAISERFEFTDTAAQQHTLKLNSSCFLVRIINGVQNYGVNHLSTLRRQLTTMAARRITQETFDAAVQENVEEFEMEPQEALEDAIEQFKSQGVDLSNIVTQLPGDKEEHPVLAPLAALRTAIEAESEEFEGVLEALAALRAACGDDKDNKTVAAANGALDLITTIADSGAGEAPVLMQTFQSMRALVSKHADNRKLVPKRFVETVASSVAAKPDDADLLEASIACAATLCFRTEAHKRVMYDKGAAAMCIELLGSHADNLGVVKASMGMLRNVITNDDRSEPMSKTFDFARELHEGGLSTAVLGVARANEAHAGVTTDAFSLLRSVCVNNTICTEVVEEGKALDLVSGAMTSMAEDKKVAAAGAALLRTLAGNDDNKKLIGAPDSPTLRVLLQAMQKHADDAKVSEHCCGAVAALTLRSPDNASTLVDNGAHALVATALRKHSKSAPVARQACLAVRNIVSRSPDLRSKFTSEGIQKLLEYVQQTHKSARDYARAALRDLGLEYGASAVATSALERASAADESKTK